MTAKRVVITGVGLCSPIGNSLDEVSGALQELRHGIVTLDEWAAIDRLNTRLAAPVSGVSPKDFPRKVVRSMGRVAVLAAWASDRALEDSGLERDYVASGAVGLAYGSTHGSSGALADFCNTIFARNSLAGLEASTYLKFMSHTCAANLAIYYAIRGRVITTSAACVSGSQAIGAAYEAIRGGQQEAMLCGGAEELHFTHAGVFDIMFATSTRYNDRPEASPRPFDVERDGLVVGEGAATLVLESYEHASARGAHIYGEIVGYGTNCDGTHVTRPSAEGMAGAMRLALADAQLDKGDIDYINAHGTATELGDIAESAATAAVFGTETPISSTKSYTGHTLGACGSIEAVFSIAALRDSFMPPTRNLEQVDPRCAPLNYLKTEARPAKLARVVSSNFAFGGLNTCLVFAKL